MQNEARLQKGLWLIVTVKEWRQKPGTCQSHGENVVKDIRRATRKQYSAERTSISGLNVMSAISSDITSPRKSRQTVRPEGIRTIGFFGKIAIPRVRLRSRDSVVGYRAA